MRVAAILASCLLTTAAFAEDAASIHVIDHMIDYSKQDRVTDQISEFHSKFAGAGRVIHLDLVIWPEAEAAGGSHRVNAIASDGTEKPLACDGFDWLKAGHRSYGFVFNPDYNHLLLSIKGDPDGAHPFMTVACEYTAAVPGLWQLRFTGYFALSQISIPTAEGIELRPITPVVGLADD
jgi:hypothetical protein